MDKIKQKLADLRVEADHAIERAENAEAKNKKYEQAILEKDQEIGLLNRKTQLLEDDLDKSEKNSRETVEKLRQVDVKAEQFERQVHRLEQERDQWEKKFEEAEAKFKASKAELDDLVRTMGDI